MSWSGRWAGTRRRRIAVQRWAQRMILEDAVVIDTETTDLYGRIVEIAIVDAQGQVLFESLVNPGCPIEPGAFAVHGISDDDVATAPDLVAVLPRLLEVTFGRPLLAYNAPYDREVLRSDLESRQRRSEGLTAAGRWGCLMEARSAASGAPRASLGASHRAAGDAVAAAAVLRALAAGIAEPMSDAIAQALAGPLAQPLALSIAVGIAGAIADPVAPPIADGPSG